MPTKKSNFLLTRNQCVYCETTLSGQPLHSINLPIRMCATTSEAASDEVAPFQIVECKHCGQVQLDVLIELSKLYEESHNPAIGKTWQEHHDDFSKFVLKHHQGGEMVEIGGGNQQLSSRILSQADANFIPVFTQIDMHDYGQKNSDHRLRWKRSFYDSNTTELPRRCNTIVTSHVFEHLYEPMRVLRAFGYHLRRTRPRGTLVFSVPNIDAMLKAKMLNSICFEHTFNITRQSLQNMLQSVGFEITAFEDWSPYNFFVAATATGPILKDLPPPDFSQKQTVLDFVKYWKERARTLNVELKNHGDKSSAYMFGCHIFSQYLLYAGMDSNLVSGILDNDPNKQDKRLYGTNLLCSSPNILSEHESPIVVLNAGTYNKEIQEQILDTINNNTRFI